MKTTKAMCDCMGGVHSKDVKNSVVDGAELSLTEPTELTRDVNQCEIEKHEEEIKRCHGEKQKCEEHKSKVFILIKGQCSLSVKNKVEADEDREDWSFNDNVVASSKRIKELSCLTTEVQCEH